jgi:hypothetical protein
LSIIGGRVVKTEQYSLKDISGKSKAKLRNPSLGTFCTSIASMFSDELVGMRLAQMIEATKVLDNEVMVPYRKILVQRFMDPKERIWSGSEVATSNLERH